MNKKLNKYIIKYFKENIRNDYSDNKTYFNKICQHGGYDYKSVENVLEYVTKKIKNVDLTGEQDNRYCLILFGPPASGKNKAVDFGLELINKDQKSNLKKNNFFELSIDDFVEETNYWKKSYKEDLSTSENVDYNQKLYQNIRYDVNQIFELFMHCCILLKLNFTIESTGSNFQWNIEKIRDLKEEFRKSKNKNLEKYGYQVVVMYPYTNKLEVLAERAEKRAHKTGRVVTKNDYIKYDFINKAKISFDDLILKNAKYFYMICKYNTEIDHDKQKLDFDDMFVYFINHQERA